MNGSLPLGALAKLRLGSNGDLVSDVRFPQEAFEFEAKGAGIGDAPRLAKLVQSDSHHQEPRSTRLEHTPGEVLRMATIVPRFFGDKAANPINDVTTGGRHSAIAFPAWANLSIFCMSKFISFFSRWRRCDQTW
jgi:hypothetical protein